mmetsp:Transcript_10365/g.15155  ORF Transcript_10365/g.15155 Transcript_10365/m.15155 type:complete len:324 (+) Transcript_10365:23-994(+)
MEEEKDVVKRLGKVYITPSVFTICSTHTLSSEREEIMGLLLGTRQDTIKGKVEVRIKDVIICEREDKKKDRVEISETQLIQALSTIESRYGSDSAMSVVGWYHSHPHMTPFPSHVDLNTQLLHQYMEPSFVGLIFSAYECDDVHRSKLSMYSYQTNAGNKARINIPIEIDYENQKVGNTVTDTSDFASTPTSATNTSFVGLFEAPTPSPQFNNESCEVYQQVVADRFVDLLKQYMQEHKNDSHMNYMNEQKQKDSLPNDLNVFTMMHNNSIYQANMNRIIENCLMPFKHTINKQLQLNHAKIKDLEAEEKTLLAKIKQLKKKN